MLKSRRPQTGGPASTNEVVPPALATEQTRGNAAASESIAGVDPQALLNEHATGASVTVGGTLKGGRKLGEVDGNSIETQGDTRISVGVARWGAWVTMNPPLHIEPGSLMHRIATGGITVSRVQVRFEDGKAQVWLDTGAVGNVLDWAFDLEDTIGDTFEQALEGSIPGDLKGFDPFTDEDLAGRVARIAEGFSTSLGSAGGGGAGGAGDLMGQLQDPTVGVTVNPRQGSWDLGEKLQMNVGQRASVSLSADMAGSMEDALSSPQVEALRLSARDLEVEHETAGALASIRIRSAVLNPDLSIQSFDYDLSTEGILGGLKALGMLFQLRSGQDLGIRDTRSPRLEALREMIDSQVREKVPELLRAQVLANRAAIPGVDLGDLLPGAIGPEEARGPQG